MDKELFYINVEIRPQEGSAMPANMLGAVVNCYTVASSEQEAINKVERCLIEDHYEIVRINDSYPADLEQFGIEPDEEHGEPAQDDIRKLFETDDVYYGFFHGWTNEA